MARRPSAHPYTGAGSPPAPFAFEVRANVAIRIVVERVDLEPHPLLSLDSHGTRRDGHRAARARAACAAQGAAEAARHCRRGAHEHVRHLRTWVHAAPATPQPGEDVPAPRLPACDEGHDETGVGGSPEGRCRMRRRTHRRIAPRLLSGDKRQPSGNSLPPLLKFALRVIAEQENRSLSWVVEEILLDWARHNPHLQKLLVGNAVAYRPRATPEPEADEITYREAIKAVAARVGKP
jgi:hypothetical protein